MLQTSQRHSGTKYTTEFEPDDETSYADHLQQSAQNRMRLRIDSLVIDELLRWFATARNGMQEQSSMSMLMGSDDVNGLTEPQFIVMSMLICKALIPTMEYNEEEAMNLAMEEWQQEAGGEEVLPQEQVMDAIFTVADMWAAGTTAASYVQFLQRLWHRVAFGTPPDACFWRPELDVVSLDADKLASSSATPTGRLSMRATFAVFWASRRRKPKPRKPLCLADAISMHAHDGKALRRKPLSRIDLRKLTTQIQGSKASECGATNHARSVTGLGTIVRSVRYLAKRTTTARGNAQIAPGEQEQDQQGRTGTGSVQHSRPVTLFPTTLSLKGRSVKWRRSKA